MMRPWRVAATIVGANAPAITAIGRAAGQGDIIIGQRALDAQSFRTGRPVQSH
jgi:hypothetical protein